MDADSELLYEWLAPTSVKRLDVPHQVLVKQIASDGHLRLIEWVLEDVVTIEIVNPAESM